MAGNMLTWVEHKIVPTLRREGIGDISVRTKNHIVVSGKAPNGRAFRWVTASTPSDRGAEKKAIADLRRELRRCGIEEPPTFVIRKLTIGDYAGDDIWEIIRAIENEGNEA